VTGHTHLARLQELLQGGRAREALQPRVHVACFALVLEPTRGSPDALPLQRRRRLRNPLFSRRQLQLRAATATIATAAVATTVSIGTVSTVVGTAARKLVATAIIDATNVVAVAVAVAAAAAAATAAAAAAAGRAAAAQTRQDALKLGAGQDHRRRS